MHLRRTWRRKDGKRYAYRSLVETYRTAKEPRQRVVAYLGNLEQAAIRGEADILNSKPLLQAVDHGNQSRYISRVTRPHLTADRLALSVHRHADDKLGKQIDGNDAGVLHALRHTFITNLVTAGVHPKTAQALARHSTISLSLDRYPHEILGDAIEALNALPVLGDPSRMNQPDVIGDEGGQPVVDIPRQRVSTPTQTLIHWHATDRQSIERYL